MRWSLLAPFVVDDGWHDTVSGLVFDTGLDYPAAIFDERVDRFGGGGTIVGRTYALLAASIDRCLAVLDDEEDTVDGLYRRVIVRTASGVDAWAWEYGTGLDLTVIPSGDWFDRP